MYVCIYLQYIMKISVKSEPLFKSNLSINEKKEILS